MELSNKVSINLKIVYYGPGLSGKTTCIKKLYSKYKDHATAPPSLSAGSHGRTISHDLLHISVPTKDNSRISVSADVYSVPGQEGEKNRKLREYNLLGANAVIFVADSQRDRLVANINSYKELHENLRNLGFSLDTFPIVVQYNKRDTSTAMDVSTLEDQVNPYKYSSYETSAIEGKGVTKGFKDAVRRAVNLARRTGTFALSGTFDLGPLPLSKNLAEALGGGVSETEGSTFSRHRISLPKDFPLGIERIDLYFPPKQLSSDSILLGLASEMRQGDALKVVYSADDRQASNLRAHQTRDSEAIAVLSKENYRKILNSSNRRSEFSRTLSPQLEPALTSPYCTASGVDNEYMFFGRSDVLDKMLLGQSSNYILVGGRRMGKTSILQAFQRRHSEPDQQCVYLSLTGDDLTEQLSVELGFPAHTTIDVIAHNLQNKRQRYVIIIDEIDPFIKADRGRDYSVLRQLHRLSAMGTCRFILAGFWEPYVSAKLEQKSPILNFGELIFVGNLEARACEAMIVRPMSNMCVEFEDKDVVMKIVGATGRRPNLISHACKSILSQLRRNKRTITPGMVDDVLWSGQLIRELESWKRLSGLDTESDRVMRANILDRLVVYSMVQDRYLERPSLIREIRKLRLGFKKIEVEESLARLEVDYVIDNKGSYYTFAVPLFGAFLEGQHPEELLAWEVEEARDVLVSA